MACKKPPKIVDLSDALELSEVAVGKNLASRGLLFCEVYVDRGNISQYMVANYPDVSVAQIFFARMGFQAATCEKAVLEAHGEQQASFHLDGTAMHFMVTNAEHECHQ